MTIDLKARQLLDRRMDALRSLTNALTAIAKAREELDTREHQAWLAVTRAGWSNKDLAELGLTAPKQSRPTRRRRSTTETALTEHTVSPNPDNGNEYAA